MADPESLTRSISEAVSRAIKVDFHCRVIFICRYLA